VIIFGRYPVPGHTKTRLIPTLGPAGAAELQRRVTEDAVQSVRDYAERTCTDMVFCFEGGSRRRMRRWLGPGLILSPQTPGDLGARMAAAFREAFQAGCTRVVLLGTDIPDLNGSHLSEAFEALERHDLVLGPSTDGGYGLVGLRRPVNIFEGIAWGTDRVLNQTLALAEKQGCRAHRLSPLTDLDTMEDLYQWRPEASWTDPYLSVVIPTLNEEKLVGSAIRSAQNRDAEVIVVDGGSKDCTVQRATETGARIVRSPKGRALQQNRGASLARGRVILFLHADTHLPEHYMDHVFETLMDSRTVLGAFRFKTDLNTPFMKVIEGLTRFRSAALNLPYGDQGLFLRKSLFKRIGGFPPVPIAEDLLLVRKTAKLGRIKVAPVPALTSARRWQKAGPLRTTLINQLILAGLMLGTPHQTLARLYFHKSRPGVDQTRK